MYTVLLPTNVVSKIYIIVSTSDLIIIELLSRNYYDTGGEAKLKRGAGRGVSEVQDSEPDGPSDIYFAIHRYVNDQRILSKGSAVIVNVVVVRRASGTPRFRGTTPMMQETRGSSARKFGGRSAYTKRNEER